MGDDGEMPEPDVTPPQLLSSTVANNATKVSVIEKIGFTFDEELDASTVDNSIVTVTSYRYHSCMWEGACESRSIRGIATYDSPSKTITVELERPLEYGTIYDLALAGSIKDVAGNAFSGTQLSFTTGWNSNTKYVYGATSGATTYSYDTFSLDTDGRVSKRLEFNSGADGVWFNADDTVTTVTLNTYDHGQLTQERYYSTGPDNRFNTADDVISSMYQTFYDHNRVTMYAYYTLAGSDGVPGTTDPTKAADDGWGLDHQWGTADDQPINFYEFTWENGRVVKEARFTGRGADNAWHTSDDRVTSYQKFVYDGAGNRIRMESWTSGTDGLYMTSDDKVSSYIDMTYDSHGAVTTRQTRYPGTDGIAFNADDDYGTLTRYTNDDRGNQIRVDYIYDPGMDGQWQTADDPIGSRYESELDEHGLVIRAGGIGPGADGTYGTADDDRSYYEQYTYGAGGRRTSYMTMDGAGPDGLWRTADDTYNQKTDFNTD